MISVYVHIPFCFRICSYCDFCKVYKNDNWTIRYLDSLESEIKSLYKGETVKTLYIGGGTPSCLSVNQLKRLFDILNIFHLSVDCEITFEANCEDLTKEKLDFLKDKINRLSIGVETFNPKYLKILNRGVNVENILLAKKYFSNINVDLMYNFKDQRLNDLKKDVKFLLDLNVPHVSLYSLIVEKNTKLFISGYEALDDDVLDKYIENVLVKNGYKHYEISNYCKAGFESKHNLVYWNNLEYYGFGLGSGGYIDNVRYENTRNLKKYLEGNYLKSKRKLNLNETLQNEFILGFRKINGINKKNFYEKYGFDIHEIKILNDLLGDMLLENEENVFINPKYLYVSNEILIKFLENNLHEQ